MLKNIRKLLVVSMLLVAVINAYGQDKTQYVFILKNGQSITGEILKKSAGKYYEVRILDKRIIKIYNSDIKSVKRIKTATALPETLSDTIFSKFWTSIEPGIYLGLGDKKTHDMIVTNSSIYGGITIVNSFMVSSWLSCGLGIGFELYGDGSMMPFFADIRAYLGKSKIIPLIGANIGYSFGWIKNTDGADWGGYLFEPAAGILIRSNSKTNIFVKAGFKYQQVKTDYINFNRYYVNLQMITLRLGVVF